MSNEESRLTADALTGVTIGISVKKDLMGQDVYNEAHEKIGSIEIEDLIIAPDNTATYAIVGVGGFLGIGQHDVAVPVQFFNLDDHDNTTLPGVTKEMLEEAPKFEYNND